MNASLDGDEVLKKARQLIEERKPEASPQKKIAFANSVQTLVTGWTGGLGGPSVREHAALKLYGNRRRRCSFEDAVKLLISDDGPIFGPITEIHQQCWRENWCVDDDPEDIRELLGKSPSKD